MGVGITLGITSGGIDLHEGNPSAGIKGKLFSSLRKIRNLRVPILCAMICAEF